jgi:hypothetical protein
VPAVTKRAVLCWEGRREGEKQREVGGSPVLIFPGKRRRARARALPDTGVAVSRYELAVVYFTII